MSTTLTENGISEDQIGTLVGEMFTAEAPEDTQLTEAEVAELAALVALDQKRHRAAPEPDQEHIRSIFDKRKSAFTQYEIEIQFTDRVMGGTPSHPDVLGAHLRVSVGATQEEENRRMFEAAIVERFGIQPNQATIDQFVAASKDVANTKSLNGFRRDSRGLFIPTRYVKSMLREATNIAFAGDRWGATRKGPKNYLAERVFVAGDRIHLLPERQEADGLQLVIGHVDGPQGKRSTLAHHEYCLNPRAKFVVSSFQDCIEASHWMVILELAQDLGLGACRSQGYGRFAVQKFGDIAV